MTPAFPGTHVPLRIPVADVIDVRRAAHRLGNGTRAAKPSKYVPHQGKKEVERRRMQAVRAEQKGYARSIDEAAQPWIDAVTSENERFLMIGEAA